MILDDVFTSGLVSDRSVLKDAPTYSSSRSSRIPRRLLPEQAVVDMVQVKKKVEVEVAVVVGLARFPSP